MLSILKSANANVPITLKTVYEKVLEDKLLLRDSTANNCPRLPGPQLLLSAWRSDVVSKQPGQICLETKRLRELGRLVQLREREQITQNKLDPVAQ